MTHRAPRPNAWAGRLAVSFVDRDLGKVAWSLLFAFCASLLASASWAKVEATDEGVLFTYSDARAREVFLAGSFNDWNASGTSMTNVDGVWSVTMPLDPGEYEYKFVVDGQWVADPDNPTTVGEFGNSAVNVGSDNALVALQATSNTTLSPKIFIGGRALALYKYRHDDGEDRYELDRPSLDFDLDFNIRVNSDLEAHILTNISNDAENVEFFETRLNFDRGSLTLDNSDVYLQAWDNEGVVEFDDPLALVGRVGIYDHAFGYGTTGAQVKKEFAGFEAQLLYTDDADPGSGFPAVSETALDDVLSNVVFDGGVARLGNPSESSYSMINTNGAEDIAAGRLSRDLESVLGRPSRIGLLGRLDRGYSPGSLVLVERDEKNASGTTGTVTRITEGFEGWGAYGVEASVSPSPGLTLRGEFLRGESRILVKTGTTSPAVLESSIAGADTTVTFTVDEESAHPADDIDLDTSNRAYLGASLPGTLFGLDASVSWEYEDHALTAVASGIGRELESDVSTYRLHLSRKWTPFADVKAPVRAGSSFEFFDFTYDREAPWTTQIWFDDRNFWLDRGEDKVSYDRLVLLGGNDAFVWKPEITVRVPNSREIDVSYFGTIGSDAVGGAPKYLESIFKITGRPTRDWVATWDSRLVKYDVPALELSESYFSTFFEIAYEPVEQVSFAISWGVDPYVIDGPVNEYAYIGRDEFLFEQGADATAARSDFYGLADRIRAAETALEDENRIQFEARLEF